MPPAIPPAPANASNFAEGHGGLQLGASNPWILVSRGGGLGLVVGFHGNRYRRKRTCYSATCPPPVPTQGRQPTKNGIVRDPVPRQRLSRKDGQLLPRPIPVFPQLL